MEAMPINASPIRCARPTGMGRQCDPAVEILDPLPSADRLINPPQHHREIPWIGTNGLQSRGSAMIKLQVCALASVLLSTAMWAATPRPPPTPVYLGTDPGDSPADVAILLVNYRPANNGTLRCHVGVVAPLRSGASKEVGVPAVVVTRPGRHTLGARMFGLREGVIVDEHVVEAGKKYWVDCTGRSKMTVKIKVEEVEATDDAEPRKD
jgi:hypothetical protein